MHRQHRVILPILVDPTGAPLDAETAAVNALRLPLMDWWLSYGHALAFGAPVVPPVRGEWDTVAAAADTFGYACGWAYRRYPALRGPDHLALLFVRGLDRAALGSWGAGAWGYALVAWDALAALPAAELAGLVGHELGHGVGYQHHAGEPDNIMWHWWRWPYCGLVEPGGLRTLGVRREVCPAP